MKYIIYKNCIMKGRGWRIKFNTRKRRNIVLAAFLIAAAMLAGCTKSKDKSEKGAESVLNQVLSCSQQEVEEFEGLYTELMEAVTMDEPGIAQIKSSDIEEYY